MDKSPAGGEMLFTSHRICPFTHDTKQLSCGRPNRVTLWRVGPDEGLRLPIDPSVLLGQSE